MQSNNHNSQPAPDTVRLSGITVAAVSKIGEQAAGEIDETAEALLHGAQEVADNLHQLAHAIREHTTRASEQVSEFCGRACLVLSGIHDLQTRLTADKLPEPGPRPKQEPIPLDPPVPDFLTRELAKAAEQINERDA